MHRRPRCFIVGLLCALAFMSWPPCHAGEEEDLMETVRRYFQAEKDGNVRVVWDLLAPSSEFKKAFSYPFYEEMVRRNPGVLKDYKIEGTPDVQENLDRKTWPDVEKIATVKVTVSLIVDGQEEQTQVRIFTFLKESGRWFKG